MGSPSGSQSTLTALNFAKAVIQKKHTLQRVFFYGDAVNVANSLSIAPRDEIDLTAQWQMLASEHQVDLVVCIAAAVRRGILDAGEAKRHEKTANNLAEGFTLSGLGQLVEATMISDRVITFSS